MGSVRKVIKKLLSPYFFLTANREKGLVKEVQFWDKWFKTKGLNWPETYEYRVDPESVIRGYHRDAVDAIEQEVVEILDVGSGPLTAIGKKHPTRTLNITAVDPLADRYAALFEKYALNPVVRPFKCEGEGLSGFFGNRRFHYVNGQNAIDHSRDPVQCIFEMIKVAAGGGVITLLHATNEAKRESWRGLHLWNFCLTRDGQLQISGRTKKKEILTSETLGQEILNQLVGGHILTTIRVMK